MLGWPFVFKPESQIQHYPLDTTWSKHGASQGKDSDIRGEYFKHFPNLFLDTLCHPLNVLQLAEKMYDT